jgi:hypothetical protein
LELWPRIHPKWARLCETILGDSLGLGYFLGDSYHLPIHMDTILRGCNVCWKGISANPFFFSYC